METPNGWPHGNNTNSRGTYLLPALFIAILDGPTSELPVRLGGISQVILEPGIVGQFREFESPRVHSRISSWILFLAHKLTCGKHESVS